MDTRLLINRSSPIVTTSPAEIIRQDPRRVWVSIVNNSGYTVYISTEQTSDPERAYMLSEYGGTITFNSTDDSSMCGLRLYAFTLFSSATLFTAEQTEVI